MIAYICSFNSHVGIIENCKYLIATLKSKKKKNSKKSKKMAGNCSLKVLDINYVTHGRKCVKCSSFLIAANLFSSVITSKVSYMRLLRNAL